MTDGSGDTRDYIEHAKWLLEWHNKRSEAITTRAVALLGFIGVMFSLLLQGVSLDGLEPTGWTWTWFGLTAALLLGAACLALSCVTTTAVEMPSVEEFRKQWGGHMQRPKEGTGVPDIAEGLLNAKNPTGPAPVVEARNEADTRVKWFKKALFTLLGSFAFLIVLTVLQNVVGG